MPWTSFPRYPPAIRTEVSVCRRRICMELTSPIPSPTLSKTKTTAAVHRFTSMLLLTSNYGKDWCSAQSMQPTTTTTPVIGSLLPTTMNSSNNNLRQAARQVTEVTGLWRPTLLTMVLSASTTFRSWPVTKRKKTTGNLWTEAVPTSSSTRFTNWMPETPLPPKPTAHAVHPPSSLTSAVWTITLPTATCWPPPSVPMVLHPLPRKAAGVGFPL